MQVKSIKILLMVKELITKKNKEVSTEYFIENQNEAQ